MVLGVVGWDRAWWARSRAACVVRRSWFSSARCGVLLFKHTRMCNETAADCAQSEDFISLLREIGVVEI